MQIDQIDFVWEQWQSVQGNYDLITAITSDICMLCAKY